MSGIHSEIIRHAKQQKTNHTEEKNQSSKADSEMTLMIDVVHKGSSTTIIIILQMFSKLEERLNMLSRDV